VIDVQSMYQYGRRQIYNGNRLVYKFVVLSFELIYEKFKQYYLHWRVQGQAFPLLYTRLT
jgi:hypothetical protein